VVLQGEKQAVYHFWLFVCQRGHGSKEVTVVEVTLNDIIRFEASFNLSLVSKFIIHLFIIGEEGIF
jgi:hypothetical protein